MSLAKNSMTVTEVLL